MEERIPFKVLIIPQERRERRAGRSNYLSGAERFESEVTLGDSDVCGERGEGSYKRNLTPFA